MYDVFTVVPNNPYVDTCINNILAIWRHCYFVLLFIFVTNLDPKLVGSTYKLPFLQSLCSRPYASTVLFVEPIDRYISRKPRRIFGRPITRRVADACWNVTNNSWPNRTRFSGVDDMCVSRAPVLMFANESRCMIRNWDSGARRSIRGGLSCSKSCNHIPVIYETMGISHNFS